MSRSIAEKTLATAKKRDRDFVKNVKSQTFARVQVEMDGYLKRMEPWPCIAGQCGMGVEVDRKSQKQVEEIIKGLGFTVNSGNAIIYLSIPMYQKGEKKTPAQLMLYHFNQKLNKARKEQKEEQTARARKNCQAVLAKLEIGDFQSNCKTIDYYEISVNAEFDNSGDDYLIEVERIMRWRGFAKVYVLPSEWRIFIQDKKK